MASESGKEAEEIRLPGVPESDLGPPPTRPFDPRVPQEWTRVALAFILVLALVGITLALLIKGWPLVHTLDDLLKLSGIVLSPLVGIFGAVLGFYFGIQSRQSP
ncbi:hypothetical protein [Thermus caldilimi]|uniref:hypothetical protein n=1 Tax=Thermus caldilimi TaxID=2483360 RepID=UPI00107642B2|nr:hypothetical protein [Thermus caldilimi]